MDDTLTKNIKPYSLLQTHNGTEYQYIVEEEISDGQHVALQHIATCYSYENAIKIIKALILFDDEEEKNHG